MSRRESAAAGAAERYTEEAVFAAMLGAHHIGTVVRFRTWDEAREIATVVTAELRQLSANSEDVVLIYGLMAEREVTLNHNDRVILNPRADYADVPRHLGNDPRESEQSPITEKE